MSKKRAPTIINQAKELKNGEYCLMPMYAISQAANQLSFPAYRLFMAYATCGNGFSPSGTWLESMANIPSKKIYIHRHE